MSPESARLSPEEREANITALLLGELGRKEAAKVRRWATQDIELVRLRDRLKQIIGLVREAAAAEEGLIPAVPRQFSPEKRRRLLHEIRRLPRRRGVIVRLRDFAWYVPLSAAAALVLLLSVAGVRGLMGIFKASQMMQPDYTLGFASKAVGQKEAKYRSAGSEPRPDSQRGVGLEGRRRLSRTASDDGLISGRAGGAVESERLHQESRSEDLLYRNSADDNLALGRAFGTSRGRGLRETAAKQRETDRSWNWAYLYDADSAVLNGGRVEEERRMLTAVDEEPVLVAEGAFRGGMERAQRIASQFEGGDVDQPGQAVTFAAEESPAEIELDYAEGPVSTMTSSLAIAKDGVETLAAAVPETPPQSGTVTLEKQITRGSSRPAPPARFAELADMMGGEERFASGLVASGKPPATKTPMTGVPVLADTPALGVAQQAVGFDVIRTLEPSKPDSAAMAEVESEEFKRLQVMDESGDRSRSLLPEFQAEVATGDNPYSTFSLNVTDVSWKLAAASLEAGQLPGAGSIRVEEFINAFDYGDPEPAGGMPVGLVWERARHPFLQGREVIRFGVRTGFKGREAGRALNLVLVLDNSGSMERADRVAIIRAALPVLAGQLRAEDRISVVAFARQARLWVDGLSGGEAGALMERVGNLVPEGGTNLEEALAVGYETAARHYVAGGNNRVVLLTDGAANLGQVDPEVLRGMVEGYRRQGIAMDCFGVGWEGYNDDLLEELTRHGDGRYGFLNRPEEAGTEFADQLAGALAVAAEDVKVQVEFNPLRVKRYRQMGYAKHQLKAEEFRDNTVDAAELGGAESGQALYVLEVDGGGRGPLGVVRVRYREPGSGRYREHEWVVPYAGEAMDLRRVGLGMRLAVVAGVFGEWLSSSPYVGQVELRELLGYLSAVAEEYGVDERPRRLEWMIRQAQSIAGM